jgi:16S rRNA (guanine527-N7)-methyltransferase
MALAGSTSLEAALAADRARALEFTPVSRETAAQLDRFVSLLLQWQARTNLVAASTIPALWTRHIADSLQLLAMAPQAVHWVDLGSGAGFPGLILALAVADRPGASVHLVESNLKKAGFLREAARQTGAAAMVHAVRIEDFVQSHRGPTDVVTARALAPLTTLLDLAWPLLKTGVQGIFLKGQDVDAELTEAAKCWNIDATVVASRTQPRSGIVVVRGLSQRPQVEENYDERSKG